MTKVSIIVAAYNIEDYICKCLDSVVNQTFNDIEVIVVNDGSTDNTLDRLLEMSKVDNRIKIIDKKNEGLIEARKSGFKEATGEYVLFVDGDDWIDNNTIEILYNKAKTEEYDIVGYKLIIVYSDGLQKKKYSSSFKVLKENEFLELCLKGDIQHGICSKFVKRDYIINNNIKFPSNISYAEDLALTCSLAMHKPKACELDEYLYYYYQRNTSLTNLVSNKMLEIANATEFIRDELLNNNLLEIYKEEFEYLVFIHSYYSIKKLIFSGYNQIGYSLYRNWKSMNIDIYNNRYCIRLFSDGSLKTKIVFRLCQSNYSFGRIIHMCMHFKKTIYRFKKRLQWS
jgi:glycosyltransferase involved in cell wall biosynthesis